MTSATSSPQIEVASVPHGARPIMRQSVDIVLKVLNNLHLGGSWEMTFERQHTKKCNITFQFVRQDPDNNRIVHVRTKCGGKSTCWNVAIRIPDRHDPLKVIEDFKKVHPRNLKIQQRQQQPEQPTKPTIPVVRVEETQPKKPEPVVVESLPEARPKPTPLLVIGEELPWSEAFEKLERSNSAVDAAVLGFSLVGERLEMKEKEWNNFLTSQSISPLKDACLQTLACEIQALKEMHGTWSFLANLRDLTIIEAFQQFDIDPNQPVPLPQRNRAEHLFKEDQKKPQPIAADNPLCLDPSRHTDLVHNQEILDRGLMALRPYFDGNGTIERIPAIDVLVEKMDVVNFIHNQDYYKDARRAVSQILRGLVNHQFLTRWTYGEGRGTKSPTTRAFLITPKGRERLAQLNTPITTPSQPRPAIAAETIEPMTSKDHEEKHHQNGNLLAKVEEEAEALTPLMDEHDGLNEDIAAYDEFLDDNQRQMAEIEAEQQKIKTRMDKLSKEMDRLTRLLEEDAKKKASLTLREAKLAQEMESYVREKRAAVEKVAALKEKIRTILYKRPPQSDHGKSDLGA